MNPPSLRLSKRKTRHSVSSFLERVDSFEDCLRSSPKAKPESSEAASLWSRAATAYTRGDSGIKVPENNTLSTAMWMSCSP